MFIISGLIVFILSLAVFLFLLFANNGTLKITTIPEQTTVEINEEKYEPPLEIELRAGGYTVIVKKDGYKTYEEKIKIERGKTTELNISLEKKLSPEEELLLSLLPQKNMYYELTYEIKNGEVFYTASLFAILNREWQIAQYKNQLKEYKQMVVDLIKGTGVNPDQINIQWIPEEAASL